MAVARKADNLATFIYRLQKLWKPQPVEALGVYLGLYRGSVVGLGYLSRYSDSLPAGLSGDRILSGRGSAADRLRVRIPPGAWMFVLRYS